MISEGSCQFLEVFRGLSINQGRKIFHHFNLHEPNIHKYLPTYIFFKNILIWKKEGFPWSFMSDAIESCQSFESINAKQS